MPQSSISGTLSWIKLRSSSKDISQLTGDGSLRLLAMAGTEDEIWPRIWSMYLLGFAPESRNHFFSEAPGLQTFSAGIVKVWSMANCKCHDSVQVSSLLPDKGSSSLKKNFHGWFVTTLTESVQSEI